VYFRDHPHDMELQRNSSIHANSSLAQAKATISSHHKPSQSRMRSTHHAVFMHCPFFVFCAPSCNGKKKQQKAASLSSQAYATILRLKFESQKKKDLSTKSASTTTSIPPITIFSGLHTELFISLILLPPRCEANRVSPPTVPQRHPSTTKSPP
jgi:hypothetical protein